jgi:outer membrane protein assembly factor BamB
MNSIWRVAGVMGVAMTMTALGQGPGATPAGGWVGFRGNGTGVYPVKGVPTHWDIAAKSNLLWSAPLPERALSEPIMVAGKVLVCAEPEWLLCFDAATGKELWRVEASALDGEPDEKKAAAKTSLAKIIEHWKTGGDLPKEKTNTLNVAIEALKKDTGIEPLRNWIFFWQGYAYNTPISDGKVVWVRFGTGSVGCYDLAGKKVWLRKTPARSGLNIQSSQMQVVKDRVVFVEAVKAEKGSTLTRGVTGLNAATGEEVWHSKPFPPGDHADAGGLSLVHVGGTTYIVTSGGQVIDPDSGEIVGEKFGNWGYCTTVYAAGDTLYFGPQIVRLKQEGGKVVSHDPLPTGKTQAYILALEDRVYLGDKTGFAHFDASTNAPPDPKTWARFSYGFKTEGKPRTIMPVAVGGLLYCAAADGRLAVVKPGAKPELVALNVFPDPITSAPFAAEGRLWVRTTTTLYCIGTK